MYRTVATAAVVVMLLAGCGTDDEAPDVGGGEAQVTDAPQVPGPEDTPAVEGASPTNVPPVAPLPPAPGALVDGPFESELPTFERGDDGTFEGTARVTNTTDSPVSGTVTYTLSADGEQVATAVAEVDDLAAGETEQVPLESTDDFVEGPYQVEFEADAAP